MLNLGGPGWFHDVFDVKVEYATDRVSDVTAQLGGEFPVSFEVATVSFLAGSVCLFVFKIYICRHDSEFCCSHSFFI